MKKVHVVMSGGGAKGAFEVGVLKGLAEKGYEFEHSYGTSVGALNAAGLAYQGVAGLEVVWKNIKKKSDLLKFNWSNLFFMAADGIYNTKPLRKIIDTCCSGKSRIPATVTKVNIETGELVHGNSDESDFNSSVEASACIPVAMSPVDKIWVDGGVREITPLKKAIDNGAEKIVIILASPWDINPAEWELPKFPLFKSLKIGMRTIDVISHEVYVDDIWCCIRKNCDPMYKKIDLEVYAPKKLLIDTLEFDPKKIREAINQGYFSAMEGPIKLD